MAVVSVTKQMELDGEIDERGHRRYTVLYRIKVDDVRDGALWATATAGIPGLFAAYMREEEQDRGATVRHIRARRTQDPFYWDVTVQYSSEPLNLNVNEDPVLRAAGGPGGGGLPGGGGVGDTITRGLPREQNPLEWFPEITWSGNKYQEPYQFDRRVPRTPVRNSARELLSPLPTRDRTHLTLTISRAEVIYDPRLALDYHDAVNSDTIDICGLVCAPGEAKVDLITSTTKFAGNLVYQWTTYNLSFKENETIDEVDQPNPGQPEDPRLVQRNKDGWDDMLVDEGYYELNAAGKQIPIIDKGLSHIKACLNGRGQRLSKEGLALGVAYIPAPNGANEASFQPYKRLPFGPLNLPTSFIFG